MHAWNFPASHVSFFGGVQKIISPTEMEYIRAIKLVILGI